MILRLCLFGILVMPSMAWAKPSALERALVGRQIVVPFDVPVSSYGVDFDGDHDFARNEQSRLDRLRLWGTAIRGGEAATITGVRVSKRRIELILGRGGLSTTELMMLKNPNLGVRGGATARQDAGPHSIAAEGHQPSRDDIAIQNEVGYNTRPRDDTPLYPPGQDTTAGQSAIQARRAAWAYRPGVGSRLRVLFKDAVPDTLLKPEALMLALSEHVMFLEQPAPESTPSGK